MESPCGPARFPPLFEAEFHLHKGTQRRNLSFFPDTPQYAFAVERDWGGCEFLAFGSGSRVLLEGAGDPALTDSESKSSKTFASCHRRGAGSQSPGNITLYLGSPHASISIYSSTATDMLRGRSSDTLLRRTTTPWQLRRHQCTQVGHTVDAASPWSWTKMSSALCLLQD